MTERARRPSTRQIASVARFVPWWPTLLAVAWTVEWAAERDADPVSIVRSLFVVAIGLLSFTVAVRLVVRSTPRAAAFSGVAMVAAFKADNLLTAGVLLAAAAVLLEVHRVESWGGLRLPWRSIHEYFTVVSVVLVAIVVGGYAARLVTRPIPTFDPSWSRPGGVPASRPNLYVVTADGHGRADRLREGFGYDPAPFVVALEAEGFDVATASHANYLFTALSLPSFLSGAHLADLGQDLSQIPDHALLAEAIRANPTARLLERIGYRVIGVSSGFDHLGERAFGDDLDTGQLSELEYRLLQSTAVGTLLREPIDDAWHTAGARRTVASLDELVRIAGDVDGSPRAVFVHLPLPHPPYGVDATCDELPLSAAPLETGPRAGPASPAAIALAAGQVRCVDRMLVPALHEVVAADPAAVVLIVSDHGPDERLDWRSPGGPGLQDRIANLVAARTPGHDRLFPDDVSLVNVLPRLFNAYFATRLPLRPDDVYVERSLADGRIYLLGGPDEGGVPCHTGSLRPQPSGDAGAILATCPPPP